MSHIYVDKPDDRQSPNVEHKVSRFRPTYRALTEDEKALHDRIKAQAEVLERVFDQIKPGRYHSLAMTALEESVMWAVKELTS